MFKFYQKKDATTGLHAIIAIHHSNRGPALGGCRLATYANLWQASREAGRLARNMCYKAAIHNLPFSGGKTVLIAPQQLTDRKNYFQSLGKFIHELEGSYIAAVDSGVNEQDMGEIAKQTSYVTNFTKVGGDPSPYTAKGVAIAIKTAVKVFLNKPDLKNFHIVIQGVGNVGYALLKELYDHNIRFTIADKNPQTIKNCLANFAVNVVEPEKIFDIECDVFAPCAMGGILNKFTINRLRTKIIAGAANNPLAEANLGYVLQQKHILYAPDYLINAGGLICCAGQYLNKSPDWVEQKIKNISLLLTTVIEQAQNQCLPTNIIADTLVKNILATTAKV